MAFHGTSLTLPSLLTTGANAIQNIIIRQPLRFDIERAFVFVTTAYTAAHIVSIFDEAATPIQRATLTIPAGAAIGSVIFFNAVEPGVQPSAGSSQRLIIGSTTTPGTFSVRGGAVADATGVCIPTLNIAMGD